MDIQELVRAQRYFLSGATRSYAFRMEQLKKITAALRTNEALLEQAMYQDFRKGPHGGLYVRNRHGVGGGAFSI